MSDGGVSPRVKCACGLLAPRLQVKKEGDTCGRWFYPCPKPRDDEGRCYFFAWENPEDGSVTVQNDGKTKRKPSTSNPNFTSQYSSFPKFGGGGGGQDQKKRKWDTEKDQEGVSSSTKAHVPATQGSSQTTAPAAQETGNEPSTEIRQVLHADGDAAEHPTKKVRVDPEDYIIRCEAILRTVRAQLEDMNAEIRQQRNHTESILSQIKQSR